MLASLKSPNCKVFFTSLSIFIFIPHQYSQHEQTLGQQAESSTTLQTVCLSGSFRSISGQAKPNNHNSAQTNSPSASSEQGHSWDFATMLLRKLHILHYPNLVSRFLVFLLPIPSIHITLTQNFDSSTSAEFLTDKIQLYCTVYRCTI